MRRPRIKNEREQRRAEAGELRDQLLRYLQNQGAGSLDQRDSVAAIGESLAQLSRSGGVRD